MLIWATCTNDHRCLSELPPSVEVAGSALLPEESAGFREAAEEKRLPDAAVSSMCDATLLERVQRGDKNAMAELCNYHSKLVYSAALRVLREPSAAEDVLQDVLLQIWRDPTSFHPDRGSLAGFLGTIARNRSLDVLRKRRPTDSVNDLSIASASDTLKDAECNLLMEKVRYALAKLPDSQRIPVELSFLEGWTHAEIADKTGCPLGTVKTRIRAALNKVATTLQSTSSAR